MDDEEIKTIDYYEGDRIELTVDNPDSNRNLWVGQTGTVILEDGRVLVEFEDFENGHDGDRHRPGSRSCWWVNKDEIGRLNEPIFDISDCKIEELYSSSL